MTSTALRVLLLEDVPMDAELIEYELERANIGCELRRVDARDAFVSALAEFRPDVILSDFTLPQFDGMRAMELARAWAATVPFIIVTGSINEETAVQCMKAGATDYLLKSNLARIGPALLSALERERERGKQERTQAALRRSEADLRTIFESTGQALILLDKEGRVRLYNSSAARCEALCGGRIGVGARAGELSLVEEAALKEALDGKRVTIERIPGEQDGGGPTFEVSFAPVVVDGGRPIGVCVTAADITERRKIDEQLRRAERMQATGRLAGGVAHEVNNMMTAILGFGDFLLNSLEQSDPRAADVHEIVKAAGRAADVTRQLLAFSRQQVLHPRTIDLNDTVRDLLPMLRRSVGEGHELVERFCPDSCCCYADPGQVEQVVLNLVLNARDAMPKGGRIMLETSLAQFGEEQAVRHPELAMPKGEFVMLAVSDRGAGMDGATLGRVFEPFFTTKPVGQGTGLGLSTAYGIVKQSNGFIFAYSEPGEGTVFKVYLPRSLEEVTRVSGGSRKPAERGTELVLLVEDEEMVRSLTGRALREHGYSVLEARGGEEALEVFEERGASIDLVVTDVAMPGMGGRELAQRLRERSPELPILFISGYTGDDVVERGLLAAGAPFLSKPFAPEALLACVRRLLDRSKVRSATA